MDVRAKFVRRAAAPQLRCPRHGRRWREYRTCVTRNDVSSISISSSQCSIHILSRVTRGLPTRNWASLERIGRRLAPARYRRPALDHRLPMHTSRSGQFARRQARAAPRPSASGRPPEAEAKGGRVLVGGQRVLKTIRERHRVISVESVRR